MYNTKHNKHITYNLNYNLNKFPKEITIDLSQSVRGWNTSYINVQTTFVTTITTTYGFNVQASLVTTNIYTKFKNFNKILTN